MHRPEWVRHQRSPLRFLRGVGRMNAGAGEKRNVHARPQFTRAAEYLRVYCRRADWGERWVKEECREERMKRREGLILGCTHGLGILDELFRRPVHPAATVRFHGIGTISSATIRLHVKVAPLTPTCGYSYSQSRQRRDQMSRSATSRLAVNNLWLVSNVNSSRG
jgi:hypothetical protein